jgi:hypothetical protein
MKFAGIIDPEEQSDLAPPPPSEARADSGLEIGWLNVELR